MSDNKIINIGGVIIGLALIVSGIIPPLDYIGGFCLGIGIAGTMLYLSNIYKNK